MSNIKFSKEELQFIMEVTAYEKKIETLLNKARETGKLSVDELEELELDNSVERSEILGGEFDYDCNDWKLILVTGEEILVELVSETEVTV